MMSALNCDAPVEFKRGGAKGWTGGPGAADKMLLKEHTSSYEMRPVCSHRGDDFPFHET
jgi:hypothetical protein